ncbi:hypothetical protein FT643_07965 [Ketobacter sp. MCCC 1A13808]|uniref:hypothetical protein n=1 Tax=Ketobacter sp. MCCC 1A13808 TaxID=2602738 RepID=UPI0012EB3D30|nr:hypothetical protein [Ketobacter sp. MCCC 1A13808]MVF12081.1 hypothetical protein [Ketobacter sp. MCCC 1A13808]
MTKTLSTIAFLLGSLTVLWMGAGFIGANSLALIVTLIIAVTYVIGFMELHHYQAATATLHQALTRTAGDEAALNQWLASLHPSLQNSVRLRIEGERVGLPTPVLTPYLVGLLVMLGLLGTFVGMVDTLQGAVSALEGSTELSAIRAGLAAPIAGLGLAFGTSVAGVAASAMLGFASTLCRRDRMLAAQQLDRKVATDFQSFSLAYHRQQTYNALQQQAQVLPDVAGKLNTLAQQLEQMSENLGRQMIANQEQLHASTKTLYTDLANSVEQSLKDSLATSGRMAGESLQPIFRQMMESIQQDAQSTHQQLMERSGQQIQQLSEQVAASNRAVSDAWNTGFEQQLATLNSAQSSWQSSQQQCEQERLKNWDHCFGRITQSLQSSAEAISHNAETASRELLKELSQLITSSDALIQKRIDTEASWLENSDLQLQGLTSAISEKLNDLNDAEAKRGQAAVERLAQLQTTVAEQLATLGNALEQPMSRLIESASEAPRAAAEVIAQLRTEMINNSERDNLLLEERQRLMSELNRLTDSLQQTTAEQRSAIEKMAVDSTGILNEVGAKFNHHIESETAKLTKIVDHFSGSTSEMSSLGDAFGAAVNLFNESNGLLIEHLNRIEDSLQNSTTRNDEQLGYYVAQAREIIDHSLLSQQEVIEQLRQMSNNSERPS